MVETVASGTKPQLVSRGPWWVGRGTVGSSHPRWVVRLGLGVQENTRGPTARPESFRGGGPGGDRGWPTGARRLRARPHRLGLSHLSGGCQVPVIPFFLKLPVGGKQHVFGEGRGVSEWTKGCGPWGSGRCWGGVLFSPSSLHPHLPEAGKHPQALVEAPSPGPGGLQERLWRFTGYFCPVKRSPNLTPAQSQAQLPIDPGRWEKSAFHSPCESWCETRTSWGPRGGSEGVCF